MKILIANRGEIARRINATAQRLGHQTVAVYAEPDRDAPFTREATEAVLLGPASLAESYLSVERILAVANETNADAIHPGYGFLSENPGFAEAVTAAGLIWVGPSPHAIRVMGSKIEARQLADQAGVPTIPGYSDSQQPDDLAAAAQQLGYPVLIKAAAGGGGKGIRIAAEPQAFSAALSEAVSEAERSFADGRVIVERFITRPRHIEVQVVGDKHGHVLDLGTRECSVQRRYQKLLEEAPAPNLSPNVDRELRAAAVRLAESIGYDSTGTVEFVVDANDESFFFLEMNTRLQVEHPVTEEITGFDLVELQLLVAEGRPLTITQADVAFQGHAIEARINAEDPATGFTPQTGTVTGLRVPSARWDAAITDGSTITPHYDPMIAKLIVHGPTRTEATAALRTALDELLIGGVVTNTGFHRWLIDHPNFVAAEITTRFLDETSLPDDYGTFEAAGLAAEVSTAIGAGPWGGTDRRFTPHRPSRTVMLVDQHGVGHELPDPSHPKPPANFSVRGSDITVNYRGQSFTFTRLSRSQQWAPDVTSGRGEANAVTAPFPAVIAEVPVVPGQIVSGDEPIVVIEAMKMLHTLTAGGNGTVDVVRVTVGDQVESGQTLVTFRKETNA
jgi:3-methylcrotonyl-CoA carboxylase alpha subunit